jgi:hypothetical protein
MSDREVDDITQKEFNSKCNETEILISGFLIHICPPVPPFVSTPGGLSGKGGGGFTR